MRLMRMRNKFQRFPVGIIKKQDKSTAITCHKKYKDALLRLDQFKVERNQKQPDVTEPEGSYVWQ